MKILGPPSAARAAVLTNLLLLKPHARFVADMFPRLWDEGCFHAVDPVVMVAQSYKETGGGTFTGRVKPEMCNPCGLKNRQSLFPGVDDGDLPLAHARFPNWTVGAIAHAQHLRAYAGALLPDDSLILSPRYDLVTPVPNGTVEELSTRWAPSSSYGAEVAALAARLQK